MPSGENPKNRTKYAVRPCSWANWLSVINEPPFRKRYYHRPATYMQRPEYISGRCSSEYRHCYARNSSKPTKSNVSATAAKTKMESGQVCRSHRQKRKRRNVIDAMAIFVKWPELKWPPLSRRRRRRRALPLLRWPNPNRLLSGYPPSLPIALNGSSLKLSSVRMRINHLNWEKCFRMSPQRRAHCRWKRFHVRLKKYHQHQHRMQSH